MIRALSLAVALWAVATTTTAEAPERSAVPQMRPPAEMPAPAPQMRPDPSAPVAADPTELARSLRPAPRMGVAAGGLLCGRRGLEGEPVAPIRGRILGCGIAQPIRLVAVNGVRLSTPATVNCDTARALQDWVADHAVPLVGQTGGGLQALRIAASYSCRTRNSQPGARLSEHATGNAIDIAGISLRNGRDLTVSDGWRDPQDGPLLRALHASACGPFGTVLGPDGDRFHQNHFHFDVARYRSGPFCR